MTTLEDLKPGLQIMGILPEQPVTVVDINWHGTQAVTLIYKRSDGQPQTRVLYRSDEQQLAAVQEQRGWPFNADGALFRLAAEAYRIHLAHLFDPVLAVHTSLIEPLPHQITAVSTGTRMPRTNWKNMSKFEIVIPSNQIAIVFNDLVAPMFKHITNNIFESRTLAKMRDILLPNLMSGRLRVPLDFPAEVLM